jgi:hypothetical protein
MEHCLWVAGVHVVPTADFQVKLVYCKGNPTPPLLLFSSVAAY